MSDPEQPRWELLPRRPREFFELPASYDLTALKRRYNAMIRRFKPERFPAEFQKIRAAYERLSDLLRYARLSEPDTDSAEPDSTARDTGARTEPPRPEAANAPAEPPREEHAEPQSSWKWQSSTPSQPLREEPARRRLSLFERLDAESVASSYAELRDSTAKIPRDYIELALLSDVATPEDPLAFARWLLVGIEADMDASDSRKPTSSRGDAHALWQLAREYLAGSIPAEQVPALLELVAGHVRGDRFYWLTEALWLRYLRSVEFRDFSTTLRACESRIVDARSDCRISFYTRLLPAAMWKADVDSIRELLAWVDDAGRQSSAGDSQGLRLIDLLHEYHAHRGEFLDGNHVRQRMDQALADYCGGDPVLSRRAMLDCLHWIADHPEQVAKAFPRGRPAGDEVAGLWRHVAYDVELESEGDDEDWSKETRFEHVVKLIGQSNLEAAKCPMSRVSETALWLTAIGAVLCAILVLVLLCQACGYVIFHRAWAADGLNIWEAAGWNVLRILGLLAAFAAWLWFGLLPIDTLSDRQQYDRVYRPALLRFFRDARATYDDIMHEIRESEDRKWGEQELTDTDDIADAMQDDTGLILHAAAWRVCRQEDRFTDHASGDSSTIEGTKQHLMLGPTFLDGSEARRRIYKALLDQIDGLPDEGSRAFIDCQQWLAGHPDELRQAFDAPKREFEFVLAPWRKIADSLEPMTPPRPPGPVGWWMADRTARLVSRLARKERSAMPGTFALAIILLAIGSLALIIALPIRLLQHVWFGNHLDALIAGLGILALGPTIYCLGSALLDAERRVERRRYRKYWQSEAFMFVAADGRRIDAICDELERLDRTKVEGCTSTAITSFLEHARDDAALEFFAIAQRFKR